MVPSRSRCSEISKACRELFTTWVCSVTRKRRLADTVERVLDVGEAGDHRLAVVLQQLVLLALLQVEVAEQLAAMEDRRRQAGGRRIDRRFRPQQNLEHRALVAAFAGQRDAGQELRRARCRHWHWRRRDWLPPRGYRGAASAIRTAGPASRAEWRWRASEPPRTRTCSGERPISTASVVRFCLRLARAAGTAARSVSTTLSCCAISSAEAVPACARCLIRSSTRVALTMSSRAALQPVLRGQHLEIGIGDGDHGGQAHHLAVEAARDRKLFGVAQRGAVLAPEVDLVAGVERRRQIVGDDVAGAAAVSLCRRDWRRKLSSRSCWPAYGSRRR